MKKIGYLVADAGNFSHEEAAGWKFLISCEQFKNTLFPFGQLPTKPAKLNEFSALWWHYDSSTSLPTVALDPFVITSVRNYVQRGGTLLLSLLAAQYIVDLGAEETRPNFVEKGQWNRRCWAENYPDIRGLSSFQGHPIFNGLHGAAYLWNPTSESQFAAAFYEEPVIPKHGRVVAVEREYIKLNEHQRIVIEYELGKGRILTVGSFMFFAHEGNRFRPHLELFTTNCLEYLGVHPRGATRRAVPPPARQTYWSFSGRTVDWIQRKSKPFTARPERWQPKSSGLLLSREQATGNFFDIGGRRILVMGTENSGIEEVWAHPFRTLKDMRIGFKIGDRETRWADTLQPRITVRPESLTRMFTIDGMAIEETTFASFGLPSGAIHFEVTGSKPVEIILTACVDLRIMWPLSDRATGSLSYAWDDGLQAAVVHTESANGTSIVGSSSQPAEYIIGRYAEIKEGAGRLVGSPTENVQVALGLRYVLNAGEGNTIAFAGSSVSEREAIAAYKRICPNPLARLNEQATHFRSLLTQSANVAIVSSELDESYKWALVATDRFFVETPNVGTSLMAGYATTRSGWSGGHAISGRPGYAWYFGRDSVWTALAMLAYGDVAKVSGVLEFLGSYQDITGKIAHEITTSGHVHYDAADATPLYIVLMGRYLRTSNDKQFVRREFPRLLKALEFCFSTDTDGDHLIENTDIGHGWIEGGPLFPSHAELYLNACWAAALEEASYIAKQIKMSKNQRAWNREAAQIKRIINQEFWNPETEWFNFARNADGTFNTAQTILPTVAMYFGLTDPRKTKQCLREIASEAFSTGWGARMIANNDPMYKPEGYHYGSIWPLFTGWTALAELRHGLREEGLRHLRATLMLYKKFALGYIPEVLHGERCEPAGVCPHQAWSEALAVLGVLNVQQILDHRPRKQQAPQP
ncbi:MAG TPA: hypothetical protein DGH68_02105 [Bacteroidetes bacterium]|nr:hypothetical protein [Bacteroidota bacterium]